MSLICGLLLVGAQIVLRVGRSDPVFGTLRFVLLCGAYGLSSWLWILAILGFGMKHLCIASPKLAQVNEGVLPFYVLHQSVLIYVGYFVVQWNIPDLLKWLIIAPTSFVIIILLYGFLARRINLLRILFGMKPFRKAT